VDIATAPQRGTPITLLLGFWTGNAGLIVGTLYGRQRIPGAQQCEHRGQAMRRRQIWISVLVMSLVLLLISTSPGHADRDGHWYTGHAYRSHGHRGHWHSGYWHRGFHRSGGVRVFIGPGLVVPFVPYWGLYSSPPVVVAPSPRVYVAPVPPPPTYWYYCDAAQAYYPYVQQCPGGWRQVLPIPPP